MSDGKPDFLDAYAAFCAERGALCLVGPDVYRRFIELPDETMEGLLCLLYMNIRETMRRWLEDPSSRKGPQEIEDLLEERLEMVARGFARFNDEGRMVCVAPQGPWPTEEETEAISRRIRSSRPTMRMARARLNAIFSEE